MAISQGVKFSKVLTTKHFCKFRTFFVCKILCTEFLVFTFSVALVSYSTRCSGGQKEKLNSEHVYLKI